MKSTVFFLTTLAMLVLTGCGPMVVNLKQVNPPDLKVTSTGKVHLLPSTKGDGIVPYTRMPGFTNLDPYWRGGEGKGPSSFVTSDDVVEAITGDALIALKKAGYEVTTGKDIPTYADCVLQMKIEGVFTTTLDISLASEIMSTVMALKFGFAPGTVPKAMVASFVDLKDVKSGLKAKVFISGYDKSVWGITSRQGINFAMEGAIRKFQNNLVEAVENFRKDPLKMTKDRSPKLDLEDIATAKLDLKIPVSVSGKSLYGAAEVD